MDKSKLPTTTLAYVVPNFVIVASEFFDDHSGEPLAGRVIAIVRDSEDSQYAIFELPELAGVHAIHLGSTFFLGWSSV